jgi:hypothetical protein
MHATRLPPVALGHEEIFLSFLDSGTERTRRCLVCANANKPQGARHEMNFQERVNTLSPFVSYVDNHAQTPETPGKTLEDPTGDRHAWSPAPLILAPATVPQPTEPAVGG